MTNTMTTAQKIAAMTETQKAALCDKYREWASESFDQYVIEEWKEKLGDIGFYNPEISYSGFWSQGDGASFTCSAIEIEKVLRKMRVWSRYRGVLSRLSVYVELSVVRHSSRYSHENTVMIDDRINCETDKQVAQLNAMVEEISEYAKSLMRKIYRELSDEYDYHTSDAAVIEMIIANDYDTDLCDDSDDSDDESGW